MFAFRKKNALPPVDWTGKTPVLHGSICTGEQAAGYRDGKTGKFVELMLIENEGDLKRFLESYGLDRAALRHDW